MTEELGEGREGRRREGERDSELPTSESASSNDLRLNLSPLAGHILLRTDGLVVACSLQNTPQTTQPIVPKHVHLPDAFHPYSLFSHPNPSHVSGTNNLEKSDLCELLTPPPSVHFASSQYTSKVDAMRQGAQCLKLLTPLQLPPRPSCILPCACQCLLIFANVFVRCVCNLMTNTQRNMKARITHHKRRKHAGR